MDGLLILQLGTITLPVRLLTHLPLIPLVGGLSYEFIRFSARFAEDGPGRLGRRTGTLAAEDHDR